MAEYLTAILAQAMDDQITGRARPMDAGDKPSRMLRNHLEEEFENREWGDDGVGPALWMVNHDRIPEGAMIGMKFLAGVLLMRSSDTLARRFWVSDGMDITGGFYANPIISMEKETVGDAGLSEGDFNAAVSAANLSSA